MRQNGASADAVNAPTAEIGAIIRQRRTGLGLSLRDLGQRAGLSVGFLSQVERGQSSLALGSLAAVARALDTDTASLLPGAPRAGADAAQDGAMVQVTRADEPTDLAIDGRVRRYRMLAGAYRRELEPMLVTIFPADTRDEVLRAQVGEKFLYVIDGELVYLLGETEYRLGSGDSIHHPASVRHGFVNDTDSVVVAVSVVTPPVL
jgi:transcriptional regulator with XRE-family HTH domain